MVPSPAISRASPGRAAAAMAAAAAAPRATVRARRERRAGHARYFFFFLNKIRQISKRARVGPGRMKLKLRITNTAQTRSRQFGPRGGATAHPTKEKHSELGGKIVRARKYFCTVIWGLFWPFLKICFRSGFAQFKNQPGYHYTIVIEYTFSRGFQ